MTAGMMKRVVLALVIAGAAGCSQPSDYDKVATRQRAEAFCKENNAKVLSISINPFTVDSVDVECINQATGNTFSSLIKGVLKGEITDSGG